MKSFDSSQCQKGKHRRQNFAFMKEGCLASRQQMGKYFLSTSSGWSQTRDRRKSTTQFPPHGVYWPVGNTDLISNCRCLYSGHRRGACSLGLVVWKEGILTGWNEEVCGCRACRMERKRLRFQIQGTTLTKVLGQEGPGRNSVCLENSVWRDEAGGKAEARLCSLSLATSPVLDFILWGIWTLEK